MDLGPSTGQPRLAVLRLLLIPVALILVVQRSASGTSVHRLKYQGGGIKASPAHAPGSFWLCRRSRRRLFRRLLMQGPRLRCRPRARPSVVAGGRTFAGQMVEGPGQLPGPSRPSSMAPGAVAPRRSVRLGSGGTTKCIWNLCTSA